MTVYEEVSVVSSVECIGPMTCERMHEARVALGHARRDAAHVYAHPADVNEWRREVFEAGGFMRAGSPQEAPPDGAHRWMGLVVHPTTRRRPGQWVVETETVRERRALV